MRKPARLTHPFQCSSASRKFLNLCCTPSAFFHASRVSVLFSEPKIPQCARNVQQRPGASGFSALQRAENSSIDAIHAHLEALLMFQCSSASRKFLNAPDRFHLILPRTCFSALQRAENSSINRRLVLPPRPLNSSFSALQRAENSSMTPPAHQARRWHCVSVLFSEPKIPQ